MVGATTPDQSKRLVEAGLDIETADGYDIHTDTPLWSMGALWNLLHNAGIHFYQFETIETVENIVSLLVDAVIKAVKQKRI